MLEMMKAAVLAEYSVGQWVLVFFVYSLLGWIWEVSLFLVRERRFVNRGFLSGPLLPIYGFGAVGILLTCVPFKENLLIVALVGMISASLLEYVTGAAMEALFHVRYWDYSRQPFNLKGYICLLSAATWAVFSVLVVCGIHPLFRSYISQVPDMAALALSGALTVFAGIDTVISVRRAMDLRALLEAMARYAKELELIHGGLDSVSDRVAEMIAAFAERVDEKQEELQARLEPITAARDRAKQMMSEKYLGLEEGAKERFASFEKILAEVASYLPDVNSFKAEVDAAREKYERQSEMLHSARLLRQAKKAQKVLRGNPGATSRRYGGIIEILRHEDEKDRKK